MAGLRQQWQNITQTPEYQAANDSERELLRQNFRDSQVLPNFPRHQRDRVSERFDQETETQGDPNSGAFGDFLHNVASGALEGSADIAQGLTLGKANDASRYLREAAEGQRDQLSPSMIEAIANTGITWGDEGIGLKEGSSVQGWLGLIGQGAGSLAPSLIPGMAAGKALSIGGKALSLGTASNKAYQVATAAGNAQRAQKILANQQRIEKLASTAGFGGAVGTMMVGGGAEQNFQEVMNLPEAELQKSPQYQQLVQETGSKETARQRLAELAGEQGRMKNFALGAVTGAVAGRIESALLTGKGGATRIGNIGRGLGTEMSEETLQSGGQKYLSNVGLSEVGIERDPMQDVVSEALTGGAVGSIVGGGLGAAGRTGKPSSKEKWSQLIEAEKASSTALEAELGNPDLEQTERDQKEIQLGESYRKQFQYEQLRKDAPTAEQLGQVQAGQDPGPTEDTPTPDTPERRHYVPADIDERITLTSKHRRQYESDMRRSLQNGGDAKTAQQYERLLSDTDTQLRLYQALRDNRGNQQYFETGEDFHRWINQGLQGRQKRRAAAAELRIRKAGKSLDEALQSRPARNLAQARGARVLKERHISQQEQQYADLEQQQSERNQSARQQREKRGGRSRRQWQEQQAPQRLALQKVRQQKSDEKPAKAVPEPTAEPTEQPAALQLPAGARSQRQQVIEQLKSLPQNYSQHGQVRRVLGDLATQGNARIHYGDGQVLAIDRGRYDPKQMQRFLSHSRNTQASEQRRQQRQKALRTVEKGTGKQGRQALKQMHRNVLMRALKGFPDSDVRAWKVRTLLNAIDEGKSRRIPYGDGQSLRITNGRYDTGELRRFAKHMTREASQGPRQAPSAKPGRAAGSGKAPRTAPTRQEQLTQRANFYDQLRDLPEAARQDWKYTTVVNALENRGDTKLSYGSGKELTVRKGLYDPKEMADFVEEMRQQGEASQARKATRPAPEPPPTVDETPSKPPEPTATDLDDLLGGTEPGQLKALNPKTAAEVASEVAAAKSDLPAEPEKAATSGEPVKKTAESSQVPADTLDPKDLMQEVNQIVYDNMPSDLRETTRVNNYRGFSQTLAKAIVDKNVDQLLGILDQGRDSNPGSKRAFQWATGQEGIGLTAKANRQAVYDWAGWNQQQIDARLKAREKALVDKIAERNKQAAVTAAENVHMTVDGKPGTLKQWVDNLIDQGATELKKSGDTIPRYWLVNPGTDRGMDLSKLSRQKGGKGLPKVAKEYAEVALAQQQEKLKEVPQKNQAEKKPEAIAFSPGFSTSEYRNQVRQDIERNLKNKFLEQYRGFKEIPYPFVSSLIHRDYEKAVDDVVRGRLSPNAAKSVARKAVAAAALTQEQADQFTKKVEALSVEARPGSEPESAKAKAEATPKPEPVKKKLQVGDRVNTTSGYGYGTVRRVGRQYAEVVNDLSGMVSRKPITQLTPVAQGDRSEELQTINRKLEGLARKLLANPGNWKADINEFVPFLKDAAYRDDSIPLKNARQIAGLLDDEGVPRKGWLQDIVQKVKDGMTDKSNNQQITEPETPTVTEPETTAEPEPVKQPEPDRRHFEGQDYPLVEHTTQKGKQLQGIVLKDRKKTEAQTIDPFTFYKDGGWFIRDKHLEPAQPAETVPASAEIGTIAAETTQESTDERATDRRGHPQGTEPAEVPAAEGEQPTAGPDVGLPGTAEPGLGAGSRGSTEGSTEGNAAERPGTDHPVDATGLPVSEGDRAGPDHRGTDAPVRSEDYRITEHSLAVERGWPQKAADNIAAIRILKQLTHENRNARPDEQAILVRYVGWGASDLANNMFPVKGRELSSQWQALSDELRSLLSDSEWKEAQRSVNYAHFTGANIIGTLYKAAERFGVRSGLTLEGGMGIGHFTGLKPDSLHLQFTGVEMDPVSARIANALYPSHEVLQGDFTRIGFPDNHFDFTLGNPPYINQAVKSDPKYFNKDFMLHDYFIAKQIDALKPGGIGVFVTSSKTLDKQGQGFRQHVGEQANFLGAIRLPNTAFQQNSGTSVVTDLLFFQKKGEGVKDLNQSWIALGDHPVLKDEGNYDEHGNVPPIEVNQYFLDNPAMVLGDETMASGRWGREYTVEPGLKKKKGESQADYLKRVDAWLDKALNKALKQLPKKLVKDNPTPEQMTEQAAKYDFNPKDKEDSFYIRDDGSIGQVIDGYGQSVPVRGGGSNRGLNKKQQQYVRDYIPLRDAVMNVYRQQYGSDADWQAAVAALEQEYDAFVARHGPISQGTVRTINYKDGRPPVEQTVEPIISTLDMDPEAFRVAAIEHYDISTGEASKSRIFTERVLNVQPEPAIESAMDAVAATLNEKGYLDMERVQALYPDLPLADVVSELGDSLFMDPASGQYVIRDDYLSGNVKAKLQTAKNKAEEDPSFQRNVKALETVIPEDLPVASVPMNLGSFWIPKSLVSQFAQDEMGFDRITVNKFRHREMSSWNVSGHAEVSRYATQRKSAVDILEAALNQKTLLIRDNVGTARDPVYVTNDKETAAANAKRQELKDAFERWARQNGEVADQLTQIYNRDYNTSVPRTNDGSHLTFPGLSSKYQLRPHQADVVWRILQMGNTYMAHAVGAGKTLASIVTAMELKRLGIANKPTFAVLKSTLRQFAAEFLDAYPNANILVADEKQLDKKNRRRFLAKVANENWDAVIMTHESFGSVPMSDQFTEDYINRQIEELDDLLDNLDDDESMTRKEIENRKGNLEQTLKKMAEAAVSRKDRGLSFEETGIDYLFIDEAHQHKKIGFPTRQSNLKGVDPGTANRAADLFMKTQYLETLRPGKHTVLMSGTPVSNTMGELYNIQRYLQPRVLEANQVSAFDAWTAAFADTTTAIEMQADGGFKPVTRLTRFVGVPGLMRDVLQVMDYVGMGQMREQGLVKLPKVDKGLKVTPKAPELAAYQKELGERIKAFEALSGKEKKAKGVDAIVKILGDGRKAAIDMRMVNRTQQGPSKLDNMIDNVFDHYQKTRDNTYLDKDGNADSVRGGIQLIFSDAVNAYDQPGGKVTFSIYQHIKDTLVSRGVPADEIAFIGDYTNSLKKKRLFNDVDAGRKTILIGGSDNLGTGVNVQKRLTALHNLDINYVPAKMDQRTGRGERQGNQNPEIENFLYVTEGTTDATVLQMNENKTRMADQVLRGDFSVHNMEDTSNAADDLAQAKAIASGNPLLLEQASVNADVRRLAAMRDAHINKLADYRQRILHDTQTLESYERSQPTLEKVASQSVSTKGDAFRATINGQSLDKRKDAGEALISQLQAALTDRNPTPRTIGSLGGYELAVNYSSLNSAARLTFRAEGNEYTIATYQDGDDLTPVGLVTRAENQAAHLGTLPEKTRNNIKSLKEDIARYRKGLEEKFPYGDQLQKQQERLDEINAELEGSEAVETETETETETEAETAGESRYRLTDSPPPSKPYRTKTLAKQLQQSVGDIAHVVHYESDLPAHLQQQIQDDGVSGQVRGIFDPRTGQVYVIARNADSLDDGIRTALHESVGHKGLRNVLGEALNPTLEQIYRSLSDRQRADLRRQYANQLAGKSREEQRRIVAEEHLAHLAETDPQNNLLQRAIARIRRWLRQHFPRMAWSDNDIRQLMMDASQAAKDTRTQQQADREATIPASESSTDKVDTPDSARYKLDRASTIDGEQIREQVGSTLESLKASVRSNGALGFLGGRQITHLYSKVFESLGAINPLKQVGDFVQGLAALRNDWGNTAGEIDQDWARLARDKADYELLTRTIYDSQEAEVDPSLDTYHPKYTGTLKPDQQAEENQRQADYQRLRRQWRSLSPDARSQYNRVKEYYENLWAETKDALVKRVEGMDMDPQATGKIKSEIEAMFHRSLGQGAYFPMMRHGDYVVTGTTPEGKPYREHFETLKAMKAGQSALEELGYTDLDSGKNIPMSASHRSGVTEFSGQIFKALQSQKMSQVDDQVKNQFMDEVNQIALSLLPELSAAKRSLHRKKIAGYDTNARRAFASVAVHGANRLGRITYGWQIDREIKRMEDAVQAGSGSPLNTDERVIGQAVAVEMRKRHELNMNPQGHPAASVVTNLAFLQYLGGSAAAGFVNMTQNILVALPQLGSKYGYARTSRMMGGALMDYIRHGKRPFRDFDDFLQNSWAGLENASGKIPDDEVRLIRALVDDGTIDTTQTHALNQIKDFDIRPEDAKARDWYTKVTRAAGLFFHNAEVLNRQVAAVTAYRLMKADAAKKGRTLDFDSALEQTRTAVFDAHFDYSTFNRPRHMRGNWAKVFLIFKQHSQNMTFFLTDIFHKGLLKGGLLNKEARMSDEARTARKALYGVLGLHALFAGALGLPGMSAMLWAAGLAMEDEDDPKDMEVVLRQIFAEWFGPQQGHAMAKGVFDGYFNMAVGARLSAADLWYRGPGYDMPARQEAMYFLTNALLGPAASIGINGYVGLTDMAQGETMTGLTKILPKFIADGLKSWQYTEHGVQDRYGYTILDQPTPAESAWQAVGFQSSRRSEAMAARGALYSVRGKLQQRRNQLLRQMDKARRTQDTGLEKRTRASIDRFNEIQRGYGDERQWAIISDKSLRRSLKGREQRREKVTPVAWVPSTQRGMAESVLGAFDL